MKTSVINSILLVVFFLNAFGCVYNQAVHDLHQRAVAQATTDE